MKFLMLGKYSQSALQGMSAARTKKVVDVVRKAGGRVNVMFALLGRYDLALIVEFPGIKEALRASVLLTKLTGIGFTTSPALTVEEFDRVIA